MLRSIYQKILGAFKTSHRRKAPRRAPPRRLKLESLESRKLLTITMLTTGAISDGNFAAPNLTAGPQGAYVIDPPSSPWQFTGIAGVSADNSGFTHGDPRSPSGGQVAFIKDTGTVSQTVTLDAGVYNLSGLAAQRILYQSQPQTVEILVDGAEVAVIDPLTPVLPAPPPIVTAYAPFETANFTVAAGTHTVEFVGLSPDTTDSTAFIDEIAITPVVDGLVDGGFETPGQQLNGYATDPNSQAWQFSGTAGIAKNGSDFLTDWTEAQNAPAGTQVAYLQKTGSMSQTAYLDAGTYQIDFLAAQRAIFQTSYQEVEILVDNVPEGIVNPVNNLYGTYNSSDFTVATGVHTVEFLGLNPMGGDNTIFIDQATLTQNAILDGSFETPQLNPGAYQFTPTGTQWQFAGTAGVAHNGSAYTTNNPNAPDGHQVAIIKNNGSISQSVNLLVGSYSVSMEAAQRAGNENQQIQVLVDGAPVSVITPVGTNYLDYESSIFTITTPGMHTIELLGLSPSSGDNTAAIDNVSLLPTNDEIVDGGFETPAFPIYTYQVAPSNSPWQFSGTAGISTNASPIQSGTGPAPQGGQVAYLMNSGSMTYTTYLDANTYSLSFEAAQRIADQVANQVIEVLVDGTQVALITPASPRDLNNNIISYYALYDTSNFTVAAGVHTIEFLGLSTPVSGNSTVLIDEVNLTAAQNEIIDGGFETPVLSTDAYAVAPGGTAWQFSGIAGVTTDASGFTYVPPNLNHNGYTYNNLITPSGFQAAFVKDNGSMTQTVDLDADTYSISFLASQRILYQTQNQQIEVLVDGTQVGLFTPATQVVTINATIEYDYTPYQTVNFTVAAGAHTIEFLGLAPTSADSTAMIDSVVIAQGGALSDGSFEQPTLVTDTYQVAPTGTPWQYTGEAGVTTNWSGFTQNNPNAPDGNQVAFIKDTGSISQSVYLAAGIYNVSFMAAQRDTWQASYQSLEILVDGVQVGTATPAAPPAGSTKTSYGLYETTNFTVTAGVHTIEFLGINPQGGDNTAFIDDVQLNT